MDRRVLQRTVVIADRETTTPVMRHAIGDRLDGRYEVCSLLGEGGMAEVYRALDKTTGRTVDSRCHISPRPAT